MTRNLCRARAATPEYEPVYNRRSEYRGRGKREAVRPQINTFWLIFPKSGIAGQIKIEVPSVMVSEKLSALEDWL